MNYRHAFHAGNFADVVKHAVLARVIAYLKRKDKAFRVIDTHAGAGLYDLASDEAARTGEWRSGIGRVMTGALSADAASLLSPYLDAVRAANPDGGPSAYPGSPAIVRHLMRRQDRLTAIEKHPDEAAALKALFAGDVQTRVIELDGWLALGGHLPPKERRGLVLVDPPFEAEGEFDRLVGGLLKAHRRWPGGSRALVSDQGPRGRRAIPHAAGGSGRPARARHTVPAAPAIDRTAARRLGADRGQPALPSRSGTCGDPAGAGDLACRAWRPGPGGSVARARNGARRVSCDT